MDVAQDASVETSMDRTVEKGRDATQGDGPTASGKDGPPQFDGFPDPQQGCSCRTAGSLDAVTGWPLVLVLLLWRRRCRLL